MKEHRLEPPENKYCECGNMIYGNNCFCETCLDGIADARYEEIQDDKLFKGDKNGNTN